MKGPTVKRDGSWKDWRVGLIGISFLLACVTWQVNTDAADYTPAPVFANQGGAGGP